MPQLPGYLEDGEEYQIPTTKASPEFDLGTELSGIAGAARAGAELFSTELVDRFALGGQDVPDLPRITPAEIADRQKAEGVTFAIPSQGMTEFEYEYTAQKSRTVKDAEDRAAKASPIGRGIGYLAGGLADPTMALGVPGLDKLAGKLLIKTGSVASRSGRIAARTAVRAGQGAAEGVAGAVVMAPVTAAGQARLGREYGLEEFAMDLGMSAGGGSILRGGVINPIQETIWKRRGLNVYEQIAKEAKVAPKDGDALAAPAPEERRTGAQAVQEARAADAPTVDRIDPRDAAVDAPEDWRKAWADGLAPEEHAKFVGIDGRLTDSGVIAVRDAAAVRVLGDTNLSRLVDLGDDASDAFIEGAAMASARVDAAPVARQTVEAIADVLARSREEGVPVARLPDVDDRLRAMAVEVQRLGDAPQSIAAVLGRFGDVARGMEASDEVGEAFLDSVATAWNDASAGAKIERLGPEGEESVVQAVLDGMISDRPAAVRAQVDAAIGVGSDAAARAEVARNASPENRPFSADDAQIEKAADEYQQTSAKEPETPDEARRQADEEVQRADKDLADLEEEIKRLRETQGKASTAPGTIPEGKVTRAQVIESVRETLGDDGARWIEDGRADVLTLEEVRKVAPRTPSDALGVDLAMPDGTRKIVLVADRLGGRNAGRTLLHEIFHFQRDAVLGPAGWAELRGQIQRMTRDALDAEARGDVLAGDIDAWRNARNMVPPDTGDGLSASARAELIEEETAAYLIETAPESRFVQGIVAKVRAWLFQQGFRVELTPADLRALAVSMMRKPVDAKGRSGARFATGKIDQSTGLPLNRDGTVTVYHHTNAEAASEINKTGLMKSAGEPDIYFTTRSTPDIGYGESVVAISVNPKYLQIDDEFPGGRIDFRISAPGKVLRVKVAQPSVKLSTSIPDRIDIDGVSRPTRNSAGRPLAQDEEGVQNFWNWFGDSKVVDADGKPTSYAFDYSDMLYEMNSIQKEIKKRERRGIDVSDLEDALDAKKNEINLFSKSALPHVDSYSSYDFALSTKKIIDYGEFPYYGVRVNSKNPNSGEFYPVTIGGEARKSYQSGSGNLDGHGTSAIEINNENYNDPTSLVDPYIGLGNEIVLLGSNSRSYGLDDGEIEMDEPVILAILREKRPTGNRGTFDPTNPDIRFSRRVTPATLREGLRDATDKLDRAEKLWPAALERLKEFSVKSFDADDDYAAGLELMAIDRLMQSDESITAEDATALLSAWMSTGGDVEKAAEQLLMAQAAIVRRNAIGARKTARNFRDIVAAWKPDEIAEGLISLDDASMMLRTRSRDGAAQRQKGFEHTYKGYLSRKLGDLSEYAAGRLPSGRKMTDVERRARDLEIFTALREGFLPSGPNPSNLSDASLRVADAIRQTFNLMRRRGHDLGEILGELEDWGLTQAHDRQKLQNAAATLTGDKRAGTVVRAAISRKRGKFAKLGSRENFEAWAAFAVPHMDLDRMGIRVDPSLPPSQWTKKARRALESIYEGAAGLKQRADEFGVVERKEVPGEIDDPRGVLEAFEGMQARRVIHFKDASSAFKYHEMFGPRDLFGSVTAIIEKNARSHGMRYIYGASPETARGRLIQMLRDNVGMEGRASGFSKRQAWKMNVVHDEVTGRLNDPVNAVASRGLANARAYSGAAKLAGTVVTQLLDVVPASIHNAFRFRGNAFGGSLHMLGRLVSRFDGKERAAALDNLLVGHDSEVGEILRDQRGDVGGATARLYDFTMKIGGVHYLDRTNIRTIAMRVAHGFAEAASNPSTMPQTERLLAAYGIEGADDLRALREACTPVGGRPFLSPENVVNVSREALDAYAAKRGLMPDEAADDLELTIQTLISSEIQMARMAPTARTRGIMKLGTRPGTFAGEIVRAAGQFKSYPAEYARRMWVEWPDALGGKNILDMPLSGKLRMAGYMATMIAGGLMVQQIKALITGKMPLPLLSDEGKEDRAFKFVDIPLINDQTLIRAITQAGVIPIYMDQILGPDATEPSKAVAEAVLGPTIGSAFATAMSALNAVKSFDPEAENFDKAVSTVNADLVRAAKGWTPIVNHWATKAAMDRLVWWQLQEMASPGWADKFERRTEMKGGIPYMGMRPTFEAFGAEWSPEVPEGIGQIFTASPTEAVR